MFWKAIRWGGSAIVILLVLAAVLSAGSKTEEGGATPVPAQQPAEAAPQPNKNFNL